jgi:signal transduction histidine kinase
MSVLDEHGRTVAGSDVAAGGPSSRRSFPLMFFDPLLVALSPPEDLARQVWSVEVWAGDDPTLHAVSRGALRTLMVGAIAAIVLAFGLVLVSRSLRARAEFVEMRSDLVSSVTHELKTPLASIRAAASTLVSGRVGTGREVREYAQILLGEAGRLTRLVDNLLAYARVTDVTEVYSFEPVVVGDLIDEALEGFAVPLNERRFEVAVHIPLELPTVVADRTALRLLVDNLIDNAIRYSTATVSLTVSASQQNGSVVLEVADRGRGIPPEEIRHVTKKFFRGRRATPGGSGLGLAIAQRIVSDHQGTLSISSTVGTGTTVRVTLPAAHDEAIHEEAHSRR